MPQPNGKNLLHQKDESKFILELSARDLFIYICQWILHYHSYFDCYVSLKVLFQQSDQAIKMDYS